jgi:hypothetical protein
MLGSNCRFAMSAHGDVMLQTDTASPQEDEIWMLVRRVCREDSYAGSVEVTYAPETASTMVF